MQAYIDIYCERTGPEFWSEPVNAVTNLSFFIAVFFIIKLMRRYKVYTPEIMVLTGLVAAIGAGSTLFHTFATGWAMLSDTLPILLFQLLYIPTYARRVMQSSWGISIVLLIKFVILVMVFGSLPQDWLNGSIGYMPALFFVFGLGLYHLKYKKAGPYDLLIAAGFFILSLTFRTLDEALCDLLPLGVHFLWHILNGAVLYFSVRALIVNIRQDAP